MLHLFVYLSAQASQKLSTYAMETHFVCVCVCVCVVSWGVTSIEASLKCLLPSTLLVLMINFSVLGKNMAAISYKINYGNL